MGWLLGVDEAGYGPNLGPFVMSSVACRLPDSQTGTDLWRLLRRAVRKEDGTADSRLPVDDSKRVYSPARGLAALECTVHAIFGFGPLRLDSLLTRLCPDCLEELGRERWFRGEIDLPCENTVEQLKRPAAKFGLACRKAGELTWQARSVVICPERFNAVAQAADSKGAVLAEGLGRLLRWNVEHLGGEDGLSAVIDKHGGRNFYAAQLQHGLPGSMVLARRESLSQSVYDVQGLGRGLTLMFQPRADAEHFCVALASMVSKYLREVLMREFNRFWAEHVPDLKPTAGYPGDSARFLTAIRPALDRLQLGEDRVWRYR